MALIEMKEIPEENNVNPLHFDGVKTLVNILNA